MSGETLLWAGQPSPKIIFHKSDWFSIPFSLMWGGFAIFWEFGATGHVGQTYPAHTSSLSFFTLWGIPFIVIGQYLIWGRFFYEAWQKTRTYYAITSRRVLVLRAGSSRRVVERSISDSLTTSLDERSDGFGSIEFSPDPTFDSYSSRRRYSNRMGLDLNRLAFYDIPDARSVYNLIRERREKAT